MNVVIGDTSPLNYLLLIGVADVLPRLYGRVMIPPEVARELADGKAPAVVAGWIANPPEWLVIRQPRTQMVVAGVSGLDRGERAARSLGT
jgi:predicted nucleic acid-binding protein